MPPRCQLAARDFAFLQELLAKSSPGRDEAFLRLLRRKLATAIVMFPADIDERVAAIGSRIGFTANAGVPQSCTLVGDDRGEAGQGTSGKILPVTTRWGLALLGLAVDETITVEDPSGSFARLRLERVEQPRQDPVLASDGEDRGASAGEKRDSGATVLDFAGRAASPRKAPARSPFDPDDPGPSAA